MRTLFDVVLGAAYFWLVASATAAVTRFAVEYLPTAGLGHRLRRRFDGARSTRLATFAELLTQGTATLATSLSRAAGRLRSPLDRVGWGARDMLGRAADALRGPAEGWRPAARYAVVGCIAVVALGAGTTSPFWALPCRTSGCAVERWVEREREEPVLLDHDGQPLWRPVRTPYVPIQDLPPYVPAMAVAIEDKRFYHHPGVDPLAIGRAVLAGATGGMRQGASTITMQAVRQLDRGDAIYRDGTIGGKVAESRLALALEWRLSKDEILELYLNTLDLSSDAGRPVRGIEDGARTFFGKPASRLTVEEAAVLIGMVQAPSRYHPRSNPEVSIARATFVLSRLAERAPEFADDIRGFRGRLRLARPRPPATPPHVATFAAAFAGDRAGEVRTTIDGRLQEVVDREVGRLIARTERAPRYRRTSGNWLVAAAIVMDARSGAILGYGCGRPHDGRERWDPCRFGRVPFASTLKIWLALAAFDQGVARPSDTLRELEFRAGKPHREDAYIDTLRRRSAHRLDWTVAEAFARSDNYLAVLLFSLLPRDGVRDLARLGIQLDAEHPAEALGSLTKSPLEMAALTAALANGGRLLAPRMLAAERAREEARVAWDPDHLSAVRRLMADVVEEGTAVRAGRVLPPARQGFAKTGTDGAHGLLITGFVEPGDAVVFLWLGHRQPREVFSGATAGTVLANTWGTIANAAAAAGQRFHEDGRESLRLAGR